MIFSAVNLKTASLYHLATTAGSKQPYASAPDATVNGQLVPMDRKDWVMEGEALVNPYELYVDAAADVRTGDKVVIDGGTYFVRMVFSAGMGPLAHKRCSLSIK